MKRWLLLLILLALGLCVTEPAFAQSGSLYSNTAYRYTPAGIFPASGASIQICTASATGQPCSPTVTVYSDAALSLPVANPLAACTVSPQVGCIDGFGNFSFYAAQGAYTYTVTGSGITSYGPITFALSCVAGVSCVTTAGNNAFTGTNTMGKLNGFRFVDGTQFATCALAAADLGATSGLVEQSSGVPCPSVPANVTVLDATGGTNQSLLNTISLNSRSGSGLHAMMHISQTIASPTSTSDVTLYAKNLVSGALPAGAWDGVAGDVYTIGALGAIDSAFGLQGMEGTAAVNSTGGTISNAFGVTGVVDTLIGSTTNITEAHSIHAAGISKAGTGTITNAYSVLADRQIAGSTRNYSVYSKGTDLQDNGFGKDVLDLGGTPRSVVQYRNDNLTVYHPLQDLPVTGWRWSRLDGTKDYLQIDTNGVVALDTTTNFQALGGIRIGVGISTAAPSLGNTGFQHKRFGGVLGGTCPTAAAAGAPCTSGNLNWTSAFADNNYTVVCTLNGTMTGQPHIVSTTYQAAGVGITLTIAADTAVAANVAAAGFVDCTAVHD